MSLCDERRVTIEVKYHKPLPPVIDNDRPQLPSVKSHLRRLNSHIHVCIIDNKSNSIALHSTPSILSCI